MGLKQADLRGQKPKAFQIRITEDLFERLSKRAYEEEVSVNQLIFRIIEAKMAGSRRKRR